MSWARVRRRVSDCTHYIIDDWFIAEVEGRRRAIPTVAFDPTREDLPEESSFTHRRVPSHYRVIHGWMEEEEFLGSSDAYGASREAHPIGRMDSVISSLSTFSDPRTRVPSESRSTPGLVLGSSSKMAAEHSPRLGGLAGPSRVPASPSLSGLSPGVAGSGSSSRMLTLRDSAAVVSDGSSIGLSSPPMELTEGLTSEENIARLRAMLESSKHGDPSVIEFVDPSVGPPAHPTASSSSTSSSRLSIKKMASPRLSLASFYSGSRSARSSVASSASTLGPDFDTVSVQSTPNVQRFVDFEEYSRMKQMMLLMANELDKPKRLSSMAGMSPGVGARRPPPKPKKKRASMMAPPPPRKKLPPTPIKKTLSISLLREVNEDAEAKASTPEPKPEKKPASLSTKSGDKAKSTAGLSTASLIASAIAKKSPMDGSSDSSGKKSPAAATSSASSSSSSAATATGGSDALSDPRFAKYVKMKKIGMPMPSIINRMQMDQMSKEDIDLFQGKKPKKKKAGGSSGSAPMKDLSKHPKLKKYAMLYKLKTPMISIENRMKIDGLEKALIEEFMNNYGESTGKDGDEDDDDENETRKKKPSWIFTPKKKTDQKLKGVHWKTVEYDEESAKGTLWESLHKGLTRDGTASEGTVGQTGSLRLGGGVKLDFEEMEEMFAVQKKPDPSTSQRGGPSDGASGMSDGKPAKVSLLDAKRSFNVNVGLSRISLTFEEIRDAILKMDQRALPLEAIEKLRRYMPSNKELEIVKQYAFKHGAEKGWLKRMDKPERFFLCLANLCDLPERFDLWSFKIQFDSMIGKMWSDMSIISLSLDRIKNSESLKNILTAMLSVGNFINDGTHRGGAFAFKLSSIEVLDQTRTTSSSSSKKKKKDGSSTKKDSTSVVSSGMVPGMTLLMYVIKICRQNFGEGTLCVKQELAILEDSVRLKEKMVKEELDGIDSKLKVLAKKLRKHKSSVADYQMAGSVGAGISSASADASMTDDDGSPMPWFSTVKDRFDGVMAEFMARGLSEVMKIRKELNKTVSQKEQVLKFFLETPTQSWDELFGTVLKFVTTFDRSKNKYDELLEREAKKLAKEERKRKEAERKRIAAEKRKAKKKLAESEAGSVTAAAADSASGRRGSIEDISAVAERIHKSGSNPGSASDDSSNSLKIHSERHSGVGHTGKLVAKISISDDDMYGEDHTAGAAGSDGKGSPVPSVGSTDSREMDAKLRRGARERRRTKEKRKRSRQGDAGSPITLPASETPETGHPVLIDAVFD